MLLHPSIKLSVDELKKRYSKPVLQSLIFVPIVWCDILLSVFDSPYDWYEKFDKEKEYSVYTETLIWYKKNDSDLPLFTKPLIPLRFCWSPLYQLEENGNCPPVKQL